MLSERDVELIHPEAFDFVFGNLPRDKRAEFNRHLTGCRYCQGVVDEYSDIGQVIKSLPPHVEPPADLEDRTVAAMVTAMAGQEARADRRSDPGEQAAPEVHVLPEVQPPAEDATRAQPRPQLQPPAEPQDRLAVTPTVTPLPVWRRYRGRLAAVVAVAAAIIAAAIVIPLSLGEGRVTPAQATVVITLHATAAARVFGVDTATATATARQSGASWTFDLVVRGLKPLPGNEFYECWWVGPGGTKLHPVLATGGSFVVGTSGSAAVTMTTGVDPTQKFRTMEITAEHPGDGSQTGPVLLTSTTL
ncbi:MAG: hypothetical protein M3Z75_03415 [Actinomycetota bacterium]|nr:hypothetical protein [Actinomycetota bacterium]